MPLSDPIGSTAADVLGRNAQDIDRVVNGGATVTTRTGRQIMSIDQALLSLGTEPPVTFAAGIGVTRATQAVIYSGVIYHARPDAIPFTTTGTFNAAQWTMREILAYDLSITANGKGTALVGYIRPEAGAISETAKTALDLQPPSIMQFIPSAEHAAIYAKNSTFDCAPYFQSLINLGRTFTVPPGAKFRLNSALNWVSGAKMIGVGDDYNSGSLHAYRTELEFNSALCSSGIVFAPGSGLLIQDWSFDGIVFSTTGTGVAYTSFKMLDIQNTAGGGAFHFRLGSNTIQNCHHAIYADDGLFSGDFGNLSVYNCVRGLTKTSNNFSTSLRGQLKFFHVVRPLSLTNCTYFNLDVFTDFCGFQSQRIGDLPATEMPVLCYTNASIGIHFGMFGIENSRAIRFRLENYSTVSANAYEYQPNGGATPTDTLWQSSSTRVSNIIQAEQALFSVKSSLLEIHDYRPIYSTANGYPTAGAWGTGTSYFMWAGGDSPKLSFINSRADMQPYSVCAAGLEPYLSASLLNNGQFLFGSPGNWRGDIHYANGYLTVGGTTYTNDYHFFQRNRAFTEGEEAFRITPATSASSIRFFAVNGASGNSANAALKVPAAASNGRSIAAGGSVVGGGADFAEYEHNNGLRIAKGQIVGFRADGLLTLTYSEAVRFGVKSTDPSYVGGDTWQTAVEPADDAPAEAWDEFRAQLEIDRSRVDRIAYSGKVPCNVYGATPGDYIVAEVAADGGIVGVPVADPDLSQYRRAVGRVNRLLPDGRCEIAVMVH